MKTRLCLKYFVNNCSSVHDDLLGSKVINIFDCLNPIKSELFQASISLGAEKEGEGGHFCPVANKSL